MATSQTIGTDYASTVAGPTGKILMATAISCSALGSAHGSVMGGGRIIYAAALDGYVPEIFAKVRVYPPKHPKP